MIDLIELSPILIAAPSMALLIFFLKQKRFSYDKNLHFKDQDYEFVNVLQKLTFSLELILMKLLHVLNGYSPFCILHLKKLKKKMFQGISHYWNFVILLCDATSFLAYLRMLWFELIFAHFYV